MSSALWQFPAFIINHELSPYNYMLSLYVCFNQMDFLVSYPSENTFSGWRTEYIGWVTHFNWIVNGEEGSGREESETIFPFNLERMPKIFFVALFLATFFNDELKFRGIELAASVAECAMKNKFAIKIHLQRARNKIYLFVAQNSKKTGESIKEIMQNSSLLCPAHEFKCRCSSSFINLCCLKIASKTTTEVLHKKKNLMLCFWSLSHHKPTRMMITKNK